MKPSLPDFIQVLASVVHLATADFYLVLGRLDDAGSAAPNTASVVSYAHMEDIDCRELGRLHPVGKGSIDHVFFAPTMLCGSKDLEFQRLADGSFAVKGSGGDEGTCDLEKDGRGRISCPQFQRLIDGPMHYLCKSSTCAGKGLAKSVFTTLYLRRARITSKEESEDGTLSQRSLGASCLL